MSEFIREVDEEYRQDQIRTLLRRYWVGILALAIIVLGGVGGWRGYVSYRLQRDEAAGLRYFDATRMARDDRPGSISALDTFVKDAPAGYRLLARFRMASETGGGDAVAGSRAFDAIAADQSVAPDLRDIARLRAALLLMNGADPGELTRRFEPLADANAAFRNVAREMLAVVALKSGEDAKARGWLDAVMSDPLAAQDQRQRAGLFLNLLQAGKPGGTPPSAPVAAPAVAGPPILAEPGAVLPSAGEQTDVPDASAPEPPAAAPSAQTQPPEPPASDGPAAVNVPAAPDAAPPVVPPAAVAPLPEAPPADKPPSAAPSVTP